MDGDPVVGKFLEFRVHKYTDKDRSMDPAQYVAGKKKMIPLRKPTEAELANALHRSFEFERQPTDDKPWVIETDGGKGFGMDPRRLSAAPSKNSSGLEVWRLINSGTWSHPIHIHFEEGIILRRNGKEPPEWEHLRIDHTCTSFPDDPPNTTCMYNGQRWGGDGSGHVVAINTQGLEPYVKMKLHKSWSEGGDYLPYYVVVDSFPAGPANNMGVIYVPKHAHLGASAVPLIQFLPPAPLNDTYPPTPADNRGITGGGPLGGQIGIPSYFMPEDDYSPMWHIGFAYWLEPATEVVKGLKRVKELRAEGKLEIHDLPPTNVGADNYDFEDLNSIHVVNCPTPMTLDSAIHRARNASK